MRERCEEVPRVSEEARRAAWQVYVSHLRECGVTLPDSVLSLPFIALMGVIEADLRRRTSGTTGRES